MDKYARLNANQNPHKSQFLQYIETQENQNVTDKDKQGIKPKKQILLSKIQTASSNLIIKQNQGNFPQTARASHEQKRFQFSRDSRNQTILDILSDGQTIYNNEQLQNNIKFAEQIQSNTEMPRVVKNIANQFLKTNKIKQQNQIQSQQLYSSKSQKRLEPLQIKKNQKEERNINCDQIINQKDNENNEIITVDFTQYLQEQIYPLNINTANQQRKNLFSPILINDHKNDINLKRQNSQQNIINNDSIEKTKCQMQKSNFFQTKEMYKHQNFLLPLNKEELPNNLTKNLFNQSILSEYQFLPTKSSQNTNRKSLKKFKNLIKPDVSFLQDSINYTEIRQKLVSPTVKISGDQMQDKLIETTMSNQNMGKSLIQLPSSIDDLEKIIQITALNTQVRSNQIKEQQLDKYLDKNFAQIPKLSQKYTFDNQIVKKERSSQSQNQKLTFIKPNENQETRSQLQKLHFVSQEILENYTNDTLLSTHSTVKVNNYNEQINVNSLLNMNNNVPLDLGQPSSRQDTILLIDWFQQTIKMLHTNSQMEVLKKQSLIQVVFNIAIEEVCRQVSVQCIERGQIIRKIFEQYIHIVEAMCYTFQEQRLILKQDLTQKLQKYIDTYDKAMKNNQNTLNQYKLKIEQSNQDLQEFKQTLFQRNGLIEKLKKKCLNLQRDNDLTIKRLKLIEKENYELVQKCQDQSEKLGELYVNPIDDVERYRLMQLIEQEVIQEYEIKRQKILNNPLSIEQIELDAIQLNDLIQEQDKQTDTDDFEQYLRKNNVQMHFNISTQTLIKEFQDKSIWVKSHKIGNMKDQDTITDPQLLQSLIYTPLNLTQNQSYQGTPTTNKAKAIQYLQNQMTKLPSLIENDNESFTESQNSKEQDEQEILDSESDEEQIINQFSVKEDQNDQFINEINNQDKISRQQKIVSSQLTKKINAFNLNDIDKERITPIHLILNEPEILDTVKNQYEMQDYIYIYTLYFIQSFGLTQNSQLTQSYDPVMNVENFEDQILIRNLNKTKKQKMTLMEVFVNQSKERIKKLLQHENIEILKNEQEHSEFINQLITELKFTSKEIQNMGNEMKKQEKQLKFNDKLNRRFEKDLIISHDKLDNLEMENYNLREQVSELTKQFEDQKKIIQDIIDLLEKEDEQINKEEVKNKLIMIKDKITQSIIKAQNFSQEDDQTVNISINGELRNNGSNIDFNNQLDQIDKIKLNEYNNDLNQPFDIQTQNINDYEESQENGKINLQKFKDSSSKRKPKTKFKLFKLGRKRISRVRKQGTHPAQIMSKRIINTDVKNLKDIMPRKMLLRLIFQVYNEKGFIDHLIQYQQQQLLQKQNSSISQSQIQLKVPQVQLYQPSLLEWVYDTFITKYGLKNVAEKKFKQMIASCINQKDQLPRIRLFGRFIELYNEFQPTDYIKYLEIIDIFTQQLLNFKIDDDTDVILLPFVILHRAIEYFKQKFEQKYPMRILNSKINYLEKLKFPVSKEDIKKQKHLRGIREAIDFDEFSEFVLDCYSILQEEKEQMIRDVYFAVDTNNNGKMTYLQFKMIMKLFHEKSSKEAWNLFEEYGKNNEDSINTFIKYLNVDSFIQFALDKDYFDQKIQLKIQQSTNLEADFEWLQSELPNIVGVFRSRLIQINKLDDFELLDMLEDFQNSIKYPYSARVAWLSYRIVDEHIKKLYMKKMSDSFLPIDLKYTCMKLKPTQVLSVLQKQQQ